jgi:hypothetical protein
LTPVFSSVTTANGCDLRTGARGGRNGDQLRLGAELRELVDALADVHEAQRQVLEVHVRVLVHHPHDLGRVHRAAAPQRNDHVRLEGLEHVHAVAHDLERRIRLDLVEHFVSRPICLRMRTVSSQYPLLYRKLSVTMAARCLSDSSSSANDSAPRRK